MLGSMALNIFKTVRRWRFLDEFIEAGLGAAVFIGWFGGSIAVGPALAFLLRWVGVPLGDDWFGRVVLGGIAAGVLAGFPLASRLEKWIKHVALQPGVNRGTAAIGDDGVRLTGLFLERFVSWLALEEVTVVDNGYRVLLQLRDGRKLGFRVPEAREFRKALLERRAAVLERSPASPINAFRDATGDLPRWAERAREVISGGYRSEVATPDVLIRVAEDPTANAEQRIGAALALSNAPEALRARVRVAAEATARPGLADAMTESVEGEVDVNLLKRALR